MAARGRPISDRCTMGCGKAPGPTLFNISHEDTASIVRTLVHAEDANLDDSDEALAVFLNASQQSSPAGFELSLLHEIMILGVLRAAHSYGIEGASLAADVFEEARPSSLRSEA